MHFTTSIKPDSVENCLLILTWIKEDRAYISDPLLGEYIKWPTVSIPNLQHILAVNKTFKAEVKQAPKFEIGQRVNIAEEKRVAPNPDYANGTVVDIDFDVDGTVTYKLLLRSGPYRREISVEEKYLVLAEHAAQPVSEPKFKGGQKVKIVADLTGWHGTCAMVCAVNEVSGDVCVLGDVAKEYRWYQPYQLKAEEKPQAKFKVGDRVQLDQTAPAHSNKIGSIVEVLENEEYSVKFDNHASAIMVHSGRLTLAATNPKFKAGDRVYLSCEGHYRNKQTGTVQIAYSDHDCLVQFDGHDCEHTVPETKLWQVKFAPGQPVSVAPGDRLGKYTKLEVVKVLGKNGDHLVYQLKATKADGSTTTVSARETTLSVAPVVTEIPVATIPKVHHDEAMCWAERLIMQLPQTHDGRNSWLMNYGSVDTEVLTDPEAVSVLSQHNAKVVLTNHAGHSYVINPMPAESAKTCMASGATFNWHRKEKRDA
jgi:ribosomal protein S17